MHPFLDVKSLSDEGILERLGRAYSYMNAQVGLGHNPTVRSILEVIQALEDERRERQQNISDEEFKKKFPDSNNPIELGKLDD
jgi:hypothetical protein